MDWLTGMLTGYADRSRKIEDDKFLAAREAAERENRVFRDLLNSKDKRIAAMAATGLVTGSQPLKRSKGISGWMGEMEANPMYWQILDYMQTPQLSVTEEEVPPAPAAARPATTPAATRPVTSPPPAPPPAANAAALPDTSPTQAGAAPIQVAPPPPPPPAAAASAAAALPPGASPAWNDPDAVSRPSPNDPFSSGGGHQQLLEAQTARNEPQSQATPLPPVTPPPPPPAPLVGQEIGAGAGLPSSGAGPAAIDLPSSDLPAARLSRPFADQASSVTQPGTFGTPDIRRTESWALPNVYPSSSDLAVAARRAQIQGDFQALRDIYLERGDSPEDATAQAAEDIVAMNQRGVGSSVPYQSLELEWTDADGTSHRESGSYDKRNARYLNGRGEPITGTVTRAIPYSAMNPGTARNAARSELGISLRDYQTDPVKAKLVNDRAEQMLAEQTYSNRYAGMEAAAAGPTSRAQANTLTSTYQARWNALDQPVRGMEFYLRTMVANYNRYKAGDATAWEPLRIAFVRLSEPNSVVMPSEFLRAGNIGSILDRIYGQIGRAVQGGSPLPDAMVDEMMRGASDTYQAMQTYAAGNRAAIESTLDRLGIPREDVFGRRMSVQDILGPDLMRSIGVGDTPPPPPPGTQGAAGAGAGAATPGRATIGEDAQGRTTIIISDPVPAR